MDNETLQDIVAGMRGENGFPVPFAPERAIWLSDYQALADRIEAAWKREQIGRDTLSDGRSLTVAVAEQRLHFARVEAEYSGLLNMAAARQALQRIFITLSVAGGRKSYATACGICKSIARHALKAPARNCDLIADELQIPPDKVPAEINKCTNAPIRELIRWIFAKAEPKGGAK